jgi:hypothetical protein
MASETICLLDKVCLLQSVVKLVSFVSFENGFLSSRVNFVFRIHSLETNDTPHNYVSMHTLSRFSASNSFYSESQVITPALKLSLE